MGSKVCVYVELMKAFWANESESEWMSGNLDSLSLVVVEKRLVQSWGLLPSYATIYTIQGNELWSVCCVCYKYVVNVLIKDHVS